MNPRNYSPIDHYKGNFTGVIDIWWESSYRPWAEKFIANLAATQLMEDHMYNLLKRKQSVDGITKRIT